jgi:hypothetical protein
MDPLLKGVEVGGAVDDDHDLAIHDGPLRQLLEGGAELGEVPEQWPLVTRVESDLGS